MINFLCASDSENLDSVLRYNPICYSMKKSMHEHELVNLNDSSSVSNETKITTAIPTFFFTSDKKSLNYHGQTLVLNCPMPKKQVDFVIQMIHWIENDTSTNIINGKEYVSSENGEKIYVFELNRPQKKRQSPTPKQWAIIGGSIGAGILAAIGGGMLYSNLKNSESFQDFVNTETQTFAEILQISLQEEPDELADELAGLKTRVEEEGNQVAIDIVNLLEENFDDFTQTLYNNLRGDDKKVLLLWLNSNKVDRQLIQNITVGDGDNKRTVDSKVISDNELQVIKTKINELPQNEKDFIDTLKVDSEDIVPTGELGEALEGIKAELQELTQNFVKNDDRNAFQQAVNMVREVDSGASDNQILATLFSAKEGRNVETNFVPVYEKLEESGVTDAELLNKYNNVLTFLDGEEDASLEQKIIYIYNDLYEEGKYSLKGLKDELAEGKISNFVSNADSISANFDILDAISLTLKTQNRTKTSGGDIYQNILDGDLERFEEEIDDARAMLKQMDATQGEIDETIEVNRSDTRLQEYETKLESEIEGMTQQQRENLEEDVEEGGEKLVTDIEDYAGEFVEGTI